MSAKKSTRKRKPQGGPEAQQESHVSTDTKLSDAKSAASKNLRVGLVKAASSIAAPAAQFVGNYLGSVAFHAYVAYLPLLLLPWARSSSLFGYWSDNAMTLLMVFLANGTWMEIFDKGFITDAGCAFIGMRQESQLPQVSGSDKRTTKTRESSTQRGS